MTPATQTGMSGVDYLRAIAAGHVDPPPMAALMGMEMVEVEEGRVVFAIEPGERHYNANGATHGGMAATLLDSAMGCSVHSTLPAGVGYGTLSLEVKFTRPITSATGRLLVEGKVVHRGRTAATAEGRMWAEASGKLVAHGTSSCIIAP